MESINLNGLFQQVLAFQKSWQTFSTITVCIKKKFAHYMILRVYTVMVWGDLVVVWGVSMDRTTVMLTVKWQG